MRKNIMLGLALICSINSAKGLFFMDMGTAVNQYHKDKINAEFRKLAQQHGKIIMELNNVKRENDQKKSEITNLVNKNRELLNKYKEFDKKAAKLFVDDFQRSRLAITKEVEDLRAKYMKKTTEEYAKNIKGIQEVIENIYGMNMNKVIQVFFPMSAIVMNKIKAKFKQIYTAIFKKQTDLNNAEVELKRSNLTIENLTASNKKLEELIGNQNAVLETGKQESSRVVNAVTKPVMGIPDRVALPDLSDAKTNENEHGSPRPVKKVGAEIGKRGMLKKGAALQN